MGICLVGSCLIKLKCSYMDFCLHRDNFYIHLCKRMVNNQFELLLYFKSCAACISIEYYSIRIPCFQTVAEVSITFQITVHDSSCMRQFEEFLIYFLVKNREKLTGV